MLTPYNVGSDMPALERSYLYQRELKAPKQCIEKNDCNKSLTLQKPVKHALLTVINPPLPNFRIA